MRESRKAGAKMIKQIALALGIAASSLFAQGKVMLERADWQVKNYTVLGDKDCKKFDPSIQQASMDLPDVQFVDSYLITDKGKVCTSQEWEKQKKECSVFVSREKIDATPTIVLNYRRERVNQMFGTPDPKTLENWINNTIRAYEDKDNLKIQHPKPGKVVLVDDWRQALVEIANWNCEDRYPVLCKKHPLTKKFIERYNPTEVLKSNSGLYGHIDENLIRRCLAASLGPEGMLDNVSDSLESRLEDKGVVLVDLKDRNILLGGLALASAHKQRLVFIDRSLYKTEDLLTEKQAKGLRDRIHKKIENLDSLDYLTVACDLSFAFRGKYEFLDEKYSLDNLLVRDKEGKKFAYHGRLTGNEALYQAMCAIFLQPKDALFFNTIWDNLYQTHHSDNAVQFSESILNTTQVKRPECTEKRLREELKKGYGLVLFQSRGTPDGFTVYGGRDIANKFGFYEKTSFDEDGKGSINSLDLPLPTIFLANPHSYAGANPYNNNTIGGKLLDEGAYIFFGAVSEPAQSHFNTPADIIVSLLNGNTIAEALQDRSIAQGSYYPPKEDGDFFYYDALPDGTKVSRLIFIGDPMHKLNLVRKDDAK